MIARVQLWGRTIGAVSLDEGREVAAFPDEVRPGRGDRRGSGGRRAALAGIRGPSEQDGDGLIKKIADYQQVHGVREAVRVTLIASATEDGA